MNVRSEIMRRQSEANNQAFIAKYGLLIAENWICKLRVESRECLGLFLAGLDYRDMNGVAGVTGPCMNLD